MKQNRVEISESQLLELRALVSGEVSTNKTILDEHGRDESAFPPLSPSVKSVELLR